MKKIARSLREHPRLILNGFVAKKQYNARIVDDLNTLAKLRFRKVFGLRTFDAMGLVLYYQLRDLTGPPSTHRF